MYEKSVTVIKKYKNKGLEIILGTKNAPSVSPAPGAPWQDILVPRIISKPLVLYFLMTVTDFLYLFYTLFILFYTFYTFTA